MKRFLCWLAVLAVAGLMSAWGQSGPHLGYVYPAGGKQGTTFRVTVGGQLLKGADEVSISGAGVTAEVIEYVRPLGQNELSDTWRCLHDLVKSRWSLRTMRAAATEQDPPVLPDHPWLRDLDQMSARQLSRLRENLFDPRKQLNPAISDQVEVQITIDPQAAAGDRELRLATPVGLTNPMRFQVGVLPEVREEDAGSSGDALATDAPVVALPAVLNGQIMPGEVDHFRLQARQGQQLVIRMQARALIPYLADAVPGWFQATMSLTDPGGKEVAYGDHYGFDPDPVLLYKVPADGVYGLEVRDAIYRGREDFVYRISAGELPFITQMFPLGTQAGSTLSAAISGWNLPVAKLPLDTRPGDETIRQARISDNRGAYSEATYAVDTLPESLENEPNDTVETAQKVALPQIINGRIDHPGDVDILRVDGRAGEELVAEVYARRLNSPLDSLLQLLDATGKIVAQNDDHDDPEAALTTHQADSYLKVKLPQDGSYWIVLSDTQHHGGDAYAYRLRLGPPSPDFALRVTPSSINLRPGSSATVTVHAVRKDGFAGDIEVVLKDAPAGFTLSTTHIPGDKDAVDARLSAPRGAARQVFVIQLEGHAQIGGVAVSHAVVPAENMMQAFAYWHLVPQQQLLVAVAGAKRVPAVWRPLVPGVQLSSLDPVRLPVGGTAQVQVLALATLPDRLQTPLNTIRFALCSTPRGITLQEATAVPGGVRLILKADTYLAQAGEASSLIIEASVPGDKGAAGPRRPVSLGVLPAISFQVVKP